MPQTLPGIALALAAAGAVLVVARRRQQARRLARQAQALLKARAGRDV
jgi:NAD(P)-dependent dehydrogenase (short-subunit alcohol dehydrogenase family)